MIQSTTIPARQQSLWVPGMILVGVVTLAFTTNGCCGLWKAKKRQHRDNDNNDSNNAYLPSAHEQLILRGTPMVKLEYLSTILRRNIYVKMECLNPGGTGKDRAALSMIRNAESKGMLPKPDKFLNWQYADNDLLLHPTDEIKENTEQDKMASMILQAIRTSKTGGLVVEGTSGSTGIALATLCAARGHACLVVLPDDQAKEKQVILRSLGAVVYEVPTAAISNPNHYVNLARKAAQMARERFEIAAVFADQFENPANYHVHYHRTGPEIWKQRGGDVDAFVMSSGTGGTIAGVGNYLKEHNPSIKIVLADPPGSALYNKVEHGVAYASEQRERTLRKHRYDTLAEGIGLDRVTDNFSLGLESIDQAIRVSDQEAVDMAHWMLRTEGLWMGSSSAMNMVGAIRVALELPEGSNVVTMICDTGQRHATRFWNPVFVKEWGLEWPERNCVPECLKMIVTGEKEARVHPAS